LSANYEYGDNGLVHLYNLYLTADYPASQKEFEENAETIQALRSSRFVTVPSEQLAEIIARDMHFKPIITNETITLTFLPDPLSVSIIISSYNKRKTIGRTIESAISQTIKSDIIVVDDGSEDNSVEIINQYPVTLIQQENQGSAIARNNGILSTHTKYICCLDADDWILPTYLEKCINVLEEDNSLGITYTGMRTHHTNGKSYNSFWPREFDYEKQLAGKNQISCCCVFRRTMFDRLGGYRQRYAPKGTGADDAEFWLRAGSIGYNAKFVTGELLFNYYYGIGISSNKDYFTPNWLESHPWAKDGQHPFASMAKPEKYSHPVRAYDKPLISVIITIPKEDEYHLVDALDSLEAQTMRNWEAIVVNDNPTEYIKKAFPFAHYVTTREEGIEKARSNSIFFLDNNTHLHPDNLKNIKTVHRNKENNFMIDVAKFLHDTYNSLNKTSPVVVNFGRNSLYKLFRDFKFHKGAEIGVSIGVNAKNMCVLNKGLELLCVDPWDIVKDDVRSERQWKSRLKEYYLEARYRLSQYNCDLVMDESLSAVRDVKYDSLDFVYIDGAHTFDYVMTDIIEWSKRVRPDGIVSGHDYFDFKGGGVIESVNIYTKMHNINEWFITSDGSPSWFWAKPVNNNGHEYLTRSLINSEVL